MAELTKVLGEVKELVFVAAATAEEIAIRTAVAVGAIYGAFKVVQHLIRSPR